MNNAQDMSPDFVLMRLVSAAEDDRLDEENGNLSSGGVVGGLGKEILAHSGIKGDPSTGLPHTVNNAQPSGGLTAAPDTAAMATGASLSGTPHPPPPNPPQLSAPEAQGFEFAPRGGLRPQLLVFPNLMRDADGLLDRESDRGNQDKIPGSTSSNTSLPLPFNNNVVLSPGGAQQQNRLDQTWNMGLLPQVVAGEMEGGADVCRRHRLITSPPEWPLLSDKSGPLVTMESKWSCAAGDREGAVFELARRFGELGVSAVPKMLFKNGELAQCSCQGPAGAGMEPGDDPTETSDALLVLEGLGGGDVASLGIAGECPEDATDDENGRRAFLLNRKREIVQKMSGAFSLGSFQAELSRQQVEVMGREPRAAAAAALMDTQVCGVHGNVNDRSSHVAVGDVGVLLRDPDVSSLSPTPLQSCTRAASPNPSRASTPRRRPERCASAPRTPTDRGGGVDKTLKIPAKPRKGSLKNRLSKLFRTKSCSGSKHLLDKRPSVTCSVSSAGSLMDVASTGGAEQDVDSQPRLTRAHSAFSPTSLSAFTGETVSLLDVDISQRGMNTPHPPTPPPPPRRSLSLLDDIGGPQPGPFLVSVMGASLQSLPLPLPPPPSSHTTIQHSLSLNDAFLRALPHANLMQADTQPPARLAPPSTLCPLRRPDASNFTASLRELEKCGWYWGPMNWEDAEMKLKGKPDGSFLVRDSSDPRYILSLSFRSQGVTHHTRMEHYRGTFSLWCHPKFEDRCHSVVEFIERAIMHSKNGKFLYFLRSRVPGLPPTPVQLLYPVSRFSNVKTLQHLCRFCIRQMVRIDHIQELPLPKPLISYLRKFYYYDPEEEMYLSIKSIRLGAGPEQQAESQT
ncbi:suppressor of cytokine signaling 7 [Lampris incognitus]|uniref:suppressor of cytokine signaling 7 n=1 Tax=Lampris incognitus TaxID=2546036 RepID=UPI0024B60725|nr:suppressor of cytokine signaling 7 [Lampris incognitus]